MPEFNLDTCESIQAAEQRRVAHCWVTALADELLEKAGTERYVEYKLQTDTTGAAEILNLMGIDDLAVPPGERLGRPVPIQWEGVREDKMSLFYGWTLVVPKEASRIYVLSSMERYESQDQPLRYVALGQEYAMQTSTYCQLVGVAAHPDGRVDARRLSYGENAQGATIGRDGKTRSIAHGDTEVFVNCIREIFALPPNK